MTVLLIADPQRLFREALRHLLAGQGGYAVAGETDGADRIPDLVREGCADLLILDPELPGDLAAALDAAHAACPGLRVLVLSASSDRALIGGALIAGAAGYVSKNDGAGELLAAIGAMEGGAVYVSESLSRVFDADETLVAVRPEDWDLAPVGADPAEDDGHALSDREREILVLVARGASSQEIAERLFISVPTVRKHRENIRRKLGIHNTAQVTAYAMRMGLLARA